ncbi:unnamed protein product [Symbiodinium sp. CCMP2592]|nr:unnamed protein product [Symbiodinium sp. CCMP2592]
MHHLASAENKAVSWTAHWSPGKRDEICRNPERVEKLMTICKVRLLLKCAFACQLHKLNPADFIRFGLSDRVTTFVKGEGHSERKALEEAWRLIWNLAEPDRLLACALHTDQDHGDVLVYEDEELGRNFPLAAEKARYEETLARQKDAMKEMQTKLQEMMQHSKESGAEAVVQKLMKKAGISDEVVISTEQVWVRLYRDAVTRRERQEKLRAEKQAQQQQDRETREDQVRRRESEIFAIPPIDAASPTRKEVNPSQPSPSQPTPQGSPMCAWLRADLDLSPVRVMQAPQRRRILAPPKGQLQTSHSAPSFLPAAAAVSLSQCR